MFRPLGRDQELYTFIGNIALGPDSFKRRFIEALAKMPEEQWDALYRLAKNLVDAVEEQPPPPGTKESNKKKRRSPASSATPRRPSPPPYTSIPTPKASGTTYTERPKSGGNFSRTHKRAIQIS